MASAYDVREAFERIELELIRSMARNLKGHRDWELSEGFDWMAWQVEQHKNLRAFSDANAQMYPEQFARINTAIEDLIRSMHAQGGFDEEAKILRALARGYTPPKTPLDVEGFFGVNDAKLDALLSATKRDMTRAEYAILRHTDDQYRRIIFNAQVYANTGAASLYQAVDMSTHDFLSRGINCIEYSDGRRVNIASYSEMAVRTANKRAYVQAQGDKRKGWGIALVEVAPNGAACPKCLPWLGKVLVDDVWSEGVPDGKHDLMSEAIAQGFQHPNCRDIWTTYFDDEDDEDDFEYTEEQREADEERYKAEQSMRATAVDLQQAKRLEVGSLLPANKAKATNRIGVLRQTWNAHASEAQKMGIVPPGFVAAGRAWESIKASIRSVYAPKKTSHAATTSFSASSRDVIEERFGALQTSEVIMTQERLEHIRQGRPKDAQHLLESVDRVISEPLLIVVSPKNPGTILVIGKTKDGTANYVVRLALATDEKGLSNSILTGYKVDRKRIEQIRRKALKNNGVLKDYDVLEYAATGLNLEVEKPQGKCCYAPERVKRNAGTSTPAKKQVYLSRL
jgi:hypothetical protein